MLSAAMQGEKWPAFPPFPQSQNGQGAFQDDLCALCFLFLHPLVFIPGGSKGKEESISTEGSMFFVFTQKRLCDLCVLCG